MQSIRIAFIALIIGITCARASDSTYFQQEVNYTIKVRLDDKTHMLYGEETFEYINHSSDELTFIYMHLWPNAYKTRTTALARQLASGGQYLMFYSLNENKGYIDSLDFRVNGVKAEWSFDPKHIDIARLELPQPLPAGGRITVSTPFRVKIPSGSISRLGHIGQSYQITQWYPKPAVYDQDGWHPMPYLSQGEFYSEFGSFDVSITLPSNYVVGATGDLQNEEEITFMNDLAAKGINRPDLPADNAFPESSSSLKTIRFVQSRVHDFGWFADKRWMVLKGEVSTPGTGMVVTTWALFTPKQAGLWNKAPEYLHDAIYYYSLWNGDYPYRHVTAVDGTISAGGGMEYPNVTVIGSSGSARSLETVIMHEVGHNWFYGILGSNERENAWMDEGINSFNEDRYMETKYPDATLATALGLEVLSRVSGIGELPQRTLSDVAYRINASRGLDQPLQCSAEEFTQMNYGGIVYKKTSLLFFYLKGYLGEERFDQCMRAYFDEWKFRHPRPEDLRRSFERTSGEDLGWFFGELISTNRKIDFKLKRVRKSADQGYRVVVRNTGETTGPSTVGIVRSDVSGKKRQTGTLSVTRVLKPGESDTVQVAGDRVRGDRVIIDPLQDIPQINRRNDTRRVSGLFRSVEPLSLKPFTNLERPESTQLFYIPLVGWNTYNKWMAGVSLHNRAVTRKPFEWSLSPMYSFANRNLNGFANIDVSLKSLKTGLRAQRFDSQDEGSSLYRQRSSYMLAEPFVSFTFRPAQVDPGRSLRMVFSLKYQYVRFDEQRDFSPEYDLSPVSFTSDQEFFRVAYSVKYKSDPFNSISGSISTDIATDIIRSTNAYNPVKGGYLAGELNYSHLYHKRQKKNWRARVFYGITDLSGAAGSRLPGLAGVTGASDVFLDGLYLGRSESSGLLSRQLAPGMGMLRSPYFASFRQLLALNAEIELPIKLPLTISANIASGDPLYTFDPDKPLATVVLTFAVVKDVLEVHIPLVNSSQIRESYEDRGIGFKDQIMFTCKLDAMAPFRLLRNINP